MARTKSNIKIREIKSKVKIISDESEKDNIKPDGLEDEVSSDDLPSENSNVSSNSRIASLNPSNNIQVIPRQVATSQNELKEDQAMFSQSRIYSSSPTQAVQQRTYVSAEEASRRFNPSITSSSPGVVPRSNANFDSLDMNRAGANEANRDYNKPLDLKQEEKKRRLPWEI